VSDFYSSETQDLVKKYMQEQVKFFQNFKTEFYKTFFNGREPTVAELQAVAHVNNAIGFFFVLNEKNMETYKILENLYDCVFQLNKVFSAKISKLDADVQGISQKTGVDLSKVKKEIANVKGVLNGPIFNDVIDLFKKLNDEAEKRKKTGEETFDWITRSH